MSDSEVVVDEGDTLDMGDSGGVIVGEEINESAFGGDSSDETGFLAEIGDWILSDSSVVDHSTVLSILEIIQSSSFDFKGFQ